jgi:hypothetical protein
MADTATFNGLRKAASRLQSVHTEAFDDSHAKHRRTRSTLFLRSETMGRPLRTWLP